jgi:uncharacterized alpha-E superfamily protein
MKWLFQSKADRIEAQLKQLERSQKERDQMIMKANITKQLGIKFSGQTVPEVIVAGLNGLLDQVTELKARVAELEKTK